MAAKQILLDICTDATIVPRCTRVTRRIHGIYISLTLTSLTDGTWVIIPPNEKPFTTTSVVEAETKLAEALEKVQVLA